MSKMSVVSVVVLAVALMAGAMAVHETHKISDTQDKECTTMMEVVSQEPQLSILAAVLEAVNNTALRDPTIQATVFAPTDAAFEKLLESMDVDDTDLLDDTGFLTRVLYAHIVPGQTIFFNDLEDGMSLETANVQSYLSVDLAGPSIITKDAEHNKGVNAKVIQVDIEACNIIIHVVDSVLVPINLSSAVLSDESA